MTLTFLPKGNICSPKEFKVGAAYCGLKKSKNLDICVLYSKLPAVAVAAFTTNKFRAAPVEFSEKIIRAKKKVSAIVINSGNANACTGLQGMENSQRMAKIASEALGISVTEMLVCSTGRIGVQLPMEKIKNGIESIIASGLSAKNGHKAAEAIMTTDLSKKECAVVFNAENKKITIASMTKGSGMISPKLETSFPHATMLSFITTDAVIDQDLLTETFNECVQNSFNKITVDGDMSTNDSVILLANGATGNKKINKGSQGAEIFKNALFQVMKKMAQSIVRDGEGATKFVAVETINARSEKDADLCSRAIANSLLCKTAWFGGDPNWGRIAAAAGYSGAKFNPAKTSIDYNNLPVILNGLSVGTPEAKLASEVAKKNIHIRINLAVGKYSATIWTNDISYDYVKINAEYKT
jgi:glutamate N-acetyltransferase/amino-acid N-acetyltransferase